MKASLRLLMTGMILVCAASYSRAAEGDSQRAADPAFAIRGIKGLWWDGIENYRLALPWLASHHMNFLMFCYTSFPASGKDWRRDYTPAELQSFRELASQADRLGVELSLSINPGIWSKPPLTYSSEKDYQLLWGKIRRVHAVGIHSFALCLDDINKALEPADLKRFGMLQNAQVIFVNRLWHDMETLKPRPRLIFCPSAYTTRDARAHLDYIRKIADLDPGIFIFWTGPEVCSATITADDAREFAEWVGRKPIVWDNYPVNDMFPWRPLMAPVQGRSADLGSAVAGLMANPMKQWHASKIPLATVAEYLNDPFHYDPARALNDAIDEYPTSEQGALRALLAVYGTSFLGQKNYPPAPSNDPPIAREQLPEYLAAEKALSTSPGLAPLWKDVQPTLDKDIQTLKSRIHAP